MGAPGTTEGPWTSDVEVPRLAAVRAIVGPSGDAIVIRDDRQFWLAIPCIGGRNDAEVRANARQMAASGALYDALVKARDKFLFYTQSHLAKYSPRDLDLVRKGIVDVPMGRDAYEKAQVNAEMAAMCDDALALARGESQ